MQELDAMDVVGEKDGASIIEDGSWRVGWSRGQGRSRTAVPKGRTSGLQGYACVFCWLIEEPFHKQHPFPYTLWELVFRQTAPETFLAQPVWSQLIYNNSSENRGTVASLETTRQGNLCTSQHYTPQWSASNLNSIRNPLHPASQQRLQGDFAEPAQKPVPPPPAVLSCS